jgi:hypothetical protein
LIHALKYRTRTGAVPFVIIRFAAAANHCCKYHLTFRGHFRRPGEALDDGRCRIGWRLFTAWVKVWRSSFEVHINILEINIGTINMND